MDENQSENQSDMQDFGLDDENENMDGYSQEEQEEVLKQMQEMQELLRQMTNKENMNN